MGGDVHGGPRRAQRLRLAPTNRAATEARTFVRRALGSCPVSDGLIADVVLAASELVTNAVEHGDGGVVVELLVDDARMRLRVADEATSPPVLRGMDPLSARGRGLALIHAIASAWGHEVTDGGKWVWAEFDLRR
ncbi:ATP-binding protein [Amycolatopsis sp. K13G38]|uniref:ATP-binding protein n=1 Tax=Amycolatopsis acididurans TaxID=2724524 RepID=A0ABX1IZE2_9PSEU|nr:ATP-binding protein [Amycolatopsis acididurans]NKQ52089.1 ATP-binding protein [Amycolatopsis acididurans]